MHKRFIGLLFFCILSFGVMAKQTAEYVGTQKCKSCHKSNKKGSQYKAWKKSGHAKAFEALLSDKALEIAKERKLKLPPSESPECLECHTVGFGKGGYEVMDSAFWNADPEDKAAKKAIKRMAGLQNVGCEVCHGAGSAYKKKKIMKAIFANELKAEDFGLVVVTPEETCLKCHNDRSPSFKPFNYKERVAEISHPFPESMKTP